MFACQVCVQTLQLNGIFWAHKWHFQDFLFYIREGQNSIRMLLHISSLCGCEKWCANWEKKYNLFSTQNFAPVTLFSGKKTSTNPTHLCKEFSCGLQPEALQQALSACTSNSVCKVKEYERMEWGRMGWNGAGWDGNFCEGAQVWC